MKDQARKIESQYGEALREFLAHGGETLLLRAYELGRQALAAGLGVMDMADIHHRAVKAQGTPAVGGPNGGDPSQSVEAFFRESLSPFEMVHRGHAEANAALRRVNEALEEETRRIAHTLHAEAGQLLATVYLDLAETERDLPEAHESVVRIRTHLDQMREQLRRLSHELRPPILDDLGLVRALNFLAEGLARRIGLAIHVDAILESRLGRPAEIALYRIAQEALNNIGRHAKASQAEIHLRVENGSIRFRIGDNGIGFDPNEAQDKQRPRGLGLAAIHERLAPLNGSCRIESNPGRGTEILVTLPIQ